MPEPFRNGPVRVILFRVEHRVRVVCDQRHRTIKGPGGDTAKCLCLITLYKFRGGPSLVDYFLSGSGRADAGPPAATPNWLFPAEVFLSCRPRRSAR